MLPHVVFGYVYLVIFYVFNIGRMRAFYISVDTRLLECNVSKFQGKMLFVNYVCLLETIHMLLKGYLMFVEV